jgi:hypothetical protein
MMMIVLPVATVLVAVMGDADVINVRRYCTHSKMKHRASSLNCRTHLFGMEVGNSI